MIRFDSARRRPIQATKCDMSLNRRRLIELLQRVNFGRVEHLKIVKGEPAIDTSLRVVRDVKFGGENGPRPEHGSANFVLKAQHLALFAEMDRIGDGWIELLEFKYGLPFRALIAAPAA